MRRRGEAGRRRHGDGYGKRCEEIDLVGNVGDLTDIPFSKAFSETIAKR
jgi:hypothetical protein